jgi:hypothetical protein
VQFGFEQFAIVLTERKLLTGIGSIAPDNRKFPTLADTLHRLAPSAAITIG